MRIVTSILRFPLVFLFGILFMFSGRFVSAEVYFQDSFEGGDLSAWTFAVPTAEIGNLVVHSGTSSLHIPYYLPPDVLPNDNNRFVQKDMSGFNINHFFLKGCFFLATSDKPTESRKLFYIFPSSSQMSPWDLMVSVNGGVNGVPMSFSFASNNYAYSDLRIPVWDVAKGRVFYDTWHCIEVELRLNTPSANDGELRFWLDGVKEYERVGFAARIDNNPVGRVRIGAQINRHDLLERREDRYWDDIVISSTYNGITPKPGSPTGVTVQ